MASSHLANNDSQMETNDKHLEIFCLIWLDTVTDTKEIHDTEQKLRSIINHVKKFQDVQECQEYLAKRSQQERLVLIVSGRLGREIVPSIHKLRQVTSIYVYCMKKKDNEQWACKFSKVRGVFVKLNELTSQIAADHKIQKQIEEPLSINVFSTNYGSSTIKINGAFIFFQILIDCLLRLKSSQRDKEELINLCRNEYEGNRFELQNLRKFEQDYSPDKVLWWYTMESFFYKTLNAALRTRDIHMIFLFRSYISDLYHQLKKYQSKDTLQVYRSQMITISELNSLKQCIGQLISVNSFFSTSTNYRKALSFLNNSSITSDLERVLFEIDADSEMVTSKPFAGISEHSEFVDESEVLFMLGSIFRLGDINRNDDQIWIVQMTLCSDDQHNLKQVLQCMKQDIEYGEANLRLLGKVLCKMGKFDLAEKYFNRLLNELSPNDPLRYKLYQDLRDVASLRQDYDKMIDWQQKSLAFQAEYHISTKSFAYATNNFMGYATPCTSIGSSTKWKQNGITIAGGNNSGSELNQLSFPCGICIVEDDDDDDDDQCIYITEWGNHRIIKWKYGAKSGEVVAGGNEKGNQLNQLNKPTDVIFDKENDSIIICDYGNRRVVRWSRQNNTRGKVIISDVHCFGLAMDDNGHLYVSDWKKNEVRRWKIGDTNGILVAGGNGQGDELNQLNCPTYIYVDENHSVYVSDCDNNRIMKWMKGAKQGIVVAGGQDLGNDLAQLSDPQGMIVDHCGHIYVADSSNNRIMRWSSGSKEGNIVVGGKGKGKQPNQFDGLRGLSFDREGNLYVVDWDNHRVQKFYIK